MHRFWTILGGLAEFGDALEFALEEFPFKIEGIVIECAAEVGWLDDEVMDDGPFFAGSVPKQTPSSLHKLPGIGRAG